MSDKVEEDNESESKSERESERFTAPKNLCLWAQKTQRDNRNDQLACVHWGCGLNPLRRSTCPEWRGNDEQLCGA